MTKTRVMSVFGTRPEAIKLAPIIQLLEKDNRFESLMVVTGQHREMLDQVLSLFNLHPDEDLNLMTDDQPLAQLTASIFSNLDPLLEKYHPDWVIVQGDTTTAMTAALAAYYRQIKVHILKQVCAPAINGSLFQRKSTGASSARSPTCISRQLTWLGEIC